MGGWTEGQACAEPGERTPIGTSGVIVGTLSDMAIEWLYQCTLYRDCTVHLMYWAKQSVFAPSLEELQQEGLSVHMYSVQHCSEMESSLHSNLCASLRTGTKETTNITSMNDYDKGGKEIKKIFKKETCFYLVSILFLLWWWWWGSRVTWPANRDHDCDLPHVLLHALIPMATNLHFQ